MISILLPPPLPCFFLLHCWQPSILFLTICTSGRARCSSAGLKSCSCVLRVNSLPLLPQPFTIHQKGNKQYINKQKLTQNRKAISRSLDWGTAQSCSHTNFFFHDRRIICQDPWLSNYNAIPGCWKCWDLLPSSRSLLSYNIILEL